jgi:integration host factor subunit beta
MNRSDLITHLAELHPQLFAKDAESVVKVILDALSNTLSKGGRVEIRGFGSFGLNYRPPRQGRNPKKLVVR